MRYIRKYDGSPKSVKWVYDRWERVRGHFPEENLSGGLPGRKPVPTREVLEAVLWI
jgi:hypothetical protein